MQRTIRSDVLPRRSAVPARITAPPTALPRLHRQLSLLLDRHAILLFGIPALITLFAWSPLRLHDGPGLDPSWQAALEMATHAHLGFGTQVIFTYGPLGFLYVAASGGAFSWYSGLALIAFIYTLIARFALASAVFYGARRSFGTVWGLVIATVVLRVGQCPDLPVYLIAFVWCLDPRVRTRGQEIVCVLGGAAAGVEALEKVSIGATAAIMVVIVICSLPQRRVRIAAETLGAFLTAFVGAWLVAGQPLSAVPHYLHAAEQISAGYANAMQLPAQSWELVAALFCAIVGFWAAWNATAEFARRQRIGVMLLWLIYAYSMYKEGFIRADGMHLPIYFAAILNGLFAFRFTAPHRTATLVATAAVACFYMGVAGTRTETLWRIDRGTASAVSNARDVLDPSQRTLQADEARIAVERRDAVPRRALALIADHTVDVVPSELAIAWAYRLNWRPIPVLQSYSAYTPWLDHYDAAFLRSKRAPSRLLLQRVRGGLDGRIATYDEPDTSVTMLCNYRPIFTSRRYAVLARSEDRCGTERLIETVKADWDQTIRVPKPEPHTLVLVKITGVQVGLAEQAAGLLSQSSVRSISLSGGSPPNRLLAATAADGLPLRTSAGNDYPVPFEMTLDVTTLAVGKFGQAAGNATPITYRFYSLPIKPLESPQTAAAQS